MHRATAQAHILFGYEKAPRIVVTAFNLLFLFIIN